MNGQLKTGLTIIAALVGHAAVAAADGATAQSEYHRGQAALKHGNIHEACAAFDASEQLEAKVETERSLAECDEQDGKLVAAAKLYRGLADSETTPERRRTATAKAAKLTAKAPRLRVVFSQRPDGLVLKVDGAEAPTTGDVMVDVGPHEVIATAPGFAGHASAPVDRDHGVVDVIVRMEPVAETPAPAPLPIAPTPAPGTDTTTAPAGTMTMRDEPPPRHHDHHLRYGLISAGVGVAALVGAGLLFHESSNHFDDEHALCPNSKCATPADLTHAKSLLSDGHTDRGLSYGIGIPGVALIGLGVYLLVAPHHEESDSHVSVNVGPGNGEVGYVGHF